MGQALLFSMELYIVLFQKNEANGGIWGVAVTLIVVLW